MATHKVFGLFYSKLCEWDAIYHNNTCVPSVANAADLNKAEPGVGPQKNSVEGRSVKTRGTQILLRLRQFVRAWSIKNMIKWFDELVKQLLISSYWENLSAKRS